MIVIDREQKNIPKDWSIKLLGDVIIENDKSLFQVKDADNSGDYPFFTSGEKVLTHSKSIISDENIYMATGGVANIKFFDGEASYSTDTYSIKSNENTKYIYYVLLNNLKKINNQYFSGSGLKHLQKNHFKKEIILIPPIKEQQKIVEILGTVDENIRKTQEIIEVTEKLKKGLMEKCFSGNKNFKKIKEIFDIFVGRDLQKDLFSEKKDAEHPYPIYANSLTDEGLYGYSKIARYKGDALTITARGEIGKAFFRDKDFDAIGRLLILSPKEKQNCYFYTQYINSQIKFLTEKTGVAQLTAPKVAECLLPTLNIKEQKEIAEILSAIDEKISINKKLKEKLILLKKGLMQDLLSGKVRVMV